MAIITKQKIASYYELFKAIDVSFSKEIIQVTGLVTNQVFLKCVGDFWPCVIQSSSFHGAKVVVNLKSGILQKLEKANNTVSLRFCFKVAEKGNPVTFFVNTRAMQHTPYGGSEDVALFNLQYTQRPPDDLIEILGRVLDANVNSKKRKDERIIISPDSLRKMNISKESSIIIQGVPRQCILRDISFSGVKVIMMGVAKFLANKDVSVKIDFEDPKESFVFKGKLTNAEAVEDRKELASLSILFDEGAAPLGYKVRVNDYLTQARHEWRGVESPPEKRQFETKKAEATPVARVNRPVTKEWVEEHLPVKTPAEGTDTANKVLAGDNSDLNDS